MDQQELGERLGRLEAGQEGLDRRMAEMQKENSDDHAAVISRLDKLGDAIAAKAPAEWVQGLYGRVADLERDRDEGKGKRLVVAVIFSAVVAPLMVGVFILLATGAIS